MKVIIRFLVGATIIGLVLATVVVPAALSVYFGSCAWLLLIFGPLAYLLGDDILRS